MTRYPLFISENALSVNYGTDYGHYGEKYDMCGRKYHAFLAENIYSF